ncbi:glutathione S-transferase [Leucothrix arctica]|uniref:Glutathione S-transferase n=1 Tax=Leucothrix arctica TaxID=1481894 RepID=A0A317C4P1_9GAMM|nr:glutathione S-transferase [Leucothrix arctica]PWQ93548.1 glutathione S-transferase [Leucothrix arctica]
MSLTTSEVSGKSPSTLPLLYSLQNCPYAMRARLAILLAKQTVQIRAVTMKEKPTEMLLLSPKATVPVLVIENTEATADDDVQQLTIVDESLDIMLWALNQNDPDNLLYSDDPKALPEMLKIIQENDDEFKPSLEKYKRAKRFHGDDLEECRVECEPFVQALEQRLAKHEFFMGATPSLLDYALLPFIRQFSRVNKPVFTSGNYTHLQHWLANHLQGRLFQRSMVPYPLWLDEREVCLFGE